jgi:hypothetical protein
MIEDVRIAFEAENFEDLSLCRDHTEKIFNDLSSKTKETFKRALANWLVQLELDDINDLNGFFSHIIGEDPAVYQTLTRD